MARGFTERTSIEYGFSSVFQQRLAPRLEALRRERDTQSRMTWLLLALILGGHVAILVFLWVYDFADEGFAIVLLFTAGISCLELVRRRTGDFGQRLIAIVMPEIGRFLGELSYSREGPGEAFVAPFESLRLVRPSNMKNTSHHLVGRYRDTGFEVVQAELENRRRGSRNGPERIFRGLLLRIGVPVRTPATILILKDQGRLLNTLMEWFSLGRRKAAHRVEMRDAEFEHRFAVYCADAEVARRFVTPGFMSALRAIDDEIGGKRYISRSSTSAAFDGDVFHLAIARSRRILDTRTLLRSDVSIEEEIHAIFHDITLLHRIIDRLHES
jgi:hypothetical protein